MIEHRTFFVTILCCAGLMAAPAEARSIHYGAVTHADVLACDRLSWRGDAATEGCYRKILDGADLPSARAEAAWALGEPKRANEYFRAALQQNPKDVTALVRWGDLYADLHQDAEAMEIYREALSMAPDEPFAQLGAARLLAAGFQAAAQTHLQAALNSSHAGARIGALLLMARIRLESSDRDAALDALREAKDLIADGDWPPLDAYALLVATELVEGQSGSEWVQAALDYNPSYGDIYSTPAHFLVITRRYRDAIAWYEKAVAIQPDLAEAHENLGINLLRDNQISRARKHLQSAYDRDPFSPRSVNSLRLLDSLSDFRVIDDRTSASVPMTLRLHEDEAAIIAPYAAALMRDSIEVFTARYGFELQESVVVEMYPDHEDFAVRTDGMPGLGILGATFGYLLAMDSPSSRPVAEFQWGTTLWHEMAHVFTLEATQHRVPRWFSEGISVYEEWRSGPNAGVRLPQSVLLAMEQGKFLPIASLDEGFIRPTYEGQVIVSYMQAGLVCEFVERRFGVDKLEAMLVGYGSGWDTQTVISRVLDLDLPDFDDDFKDYIDKHYAAAVEALKPWAALRTPLQQALAADNLEAVASTAAQMIALRPEYVETDSPYLMRAHALEQMGRREEAITTLTTFWSNGGYEPAALKRLAGWLAERGQIERAIPVLTSVNWVDPFDQELHGILGNLLLDAQRPQEALREFEVALALKPHDIVTAHFRLARAHAQLGDTAQAQAHLLEALDIAPSFRPAQKLLLQLAGG
jgi:tetratricopeptide (TPR) repeat protein